MLSREIFGDAMGALQTAYPKIDFGDAPTIDWFNRIRATGISDTTFSSAIDWIILTKQWFANTNLLAFVTEYQTLHQGQGTAPYQNTYHGQPKPDLPSLTADRHNPAFSAEFARRIEEWSHKHPRQPNESIREYVPRRWEAVLEEMRWAKWKIPTAYAENGGRLPMKSA